MLRAVQRFALSAIGADRPGIVSAMTGCLLEHGLNIEDSQMTILGGHFTMTLLIAAESFDEAALRRDLEQTGDRVGLEAVTLNPVDETVSGRADPSHIVTVYGVDHPGIVHAVAEVLAVNAINISDLNTRLIGEEGRPGLYAMMLEVVLPDGTDGARLEELLSEVANEQGVDVSVRELETDEL
jgi:glycine cleavage system transcriptional repressor